MPNYDALVRAARLKRSKTGIDLVDEPCSGIMFGGVIVSKRSLHPLPGRAGGGVGSMQFGGGDRGVAGELVLLRPDHGAVEGVVPQYRRMAAAIHEHGVYCTVQLTHGGRRERWDIANWLPTYSASTLREIVHGSFPSSWRIMTSAAWWISSRPVAPATAMWTAGNSLQAATLIEQFWSPVLNQRTDRHGGAFENRMRLKPEIPPPPANRWATTTSSASACPAEMLKVGSARKIACNALRRQRTDRFQRRRRQCVDYQGEAKLWLTMWVPSAAYLLLAKAIRDEVADKVRIFHATR